jgi:hypothetical protein
MGYRGILAQNILKHKTSYYIGRSGCLNTRDLHLNSFEVYASELINCKSNTVGSQRAQSLKVEGYNDAMSTAVRLSLC